MSALLGVAHPEEYWPHETLNSCSENIVFDHPFGINVILPDNRKADYLYTCVKCCKTYKFQQSLNRHLTYECGKLPQFQCPYCNEKRHLKCNLDKHIMRKHKKIPMCI
ncbi:longitudinals lacking protein, isoforms A/B/D/L-like [Schistocerca nitens]|uniref:longitudinals lacking protein, isoforms A/B/D/L-like n=1 Tax=Schistocerca nitens TaxID=7011 RepID=UPI002118C8D2|nr:longitudinals lacking protein, isoforms A/B/D/L-like [Schistocerca nitens]